MHLAQMRIKSSSRMTFPEQLMLMCPLSSQISLKWTWPLSMRIQARQTLHRHSPWPKVNLQSSPRLGHSKSRVKAEGFPIDKRVGRSSSSALSLWQIILHGLSWLFPVSRYIESYSAKIGVQPHFYKMETTHDTHKREHIFDMASHLIYNMYNMQTFRQRCTEIYRQILLQSVYLLLSTASSCGQYKHVTEKSSFKSSVILMNTCTYSVLNN